MNWYETALFSAGIVLVGNGLLQRFGVLRAERDPVVVARSKRVAAVSVALGVVALVVHAVLVLG